MRLVVHLALLWALLAPVLAAAPLERDPTQPESYAQPQVRDLVRLVNEAATRVQREGEHAFPEFREPGKWFRGIEDFYLFIFDLEGNQVLNAAFPQAETNRWGWRDAWGKPMFQVAIEKLSSDGEDRRF